MKTNRLFTTVVTLSLLSWTAARAQDSATDQHHLSSKTADQHPHKVSEQELKEKVTKINKASSFIGMKVENLQNQNLGKVEDLVFDPESGKIAYAVLSVGGFLGMNDKYIAVPLSALTPAPAEDHLLLDADKQRLQNAPGFSKDKWPDLNTPLWTAAAGYATPVRTTKTANAVGRPAPSEHEQGTASQNSEDQKYSGTISAVDKTGRTVTIKGEQGEKTFALDPSAQIKAGDDSQAKLDDLKVGTKAEVDYSHEGHKDVAKKLQADKKD